MQERRHLAPAREDGPVGFIDVGVIGCGFLLREAELAFARKPHQALDLERDRASLELSVSKADACTIGCVRTWGCTCGDVELAAEGAIEGATCAAAGDAPTGGGPMVRSCVRWVW